MDLQRLKEQKKRLGLTNAELARRAGVPVSTVAKVMGGTTPSPRINTILALERALGMEQNSEGRSAYLDGYLSGYRVSDGNRDLQIEKIPSTGGVLRKPLHTIEEYSALPDDRRVELIDGRFYDLAAPSGIHQQIVLLIWMALHQCIERHGMSCLAQAAPFDVQLDEYTIVEPDVMVFCEDPAQGLAARATAPPDLVIEVLSRSTAFKDRHLKLFKYRHAGVKELWLVSPGEERVEVYAFSEGREEPEIFTFEEEVPVLISDGKCRVDFNAIRKRLPEKLV